MQNGVKTIHCIGHSLGGAVASLAADWIKENHSSEVKLYTFGAPRVGFGSGFGQSITNKLLAKNIHRVYHGTDPVPMVPLFPFAHAPTSGQSYYLPFGGLVVNFGAHKMRNYITSIGGNDWAGVYQANPIQHSVDSIKSWLQSDTTESTQNSWVWEKKLRIILRVTDQFSENTSRTRRRFHNSRSPSDASKQRLAVGG